MKPPDWIHLPGMALALGVGSSWDLYAMATDPGAGAVFMDELFG